MRCWRCEIAKAVEILVNKRSLDFVLHKTDMKNLTRTLVCSGAAMALAVSLISTPRVQAQDAKVDFEKQVLPIFKDRCFDCHQAPFTDDTGRLKKPKGGLRMDNAELMLAGGEGETADGKGEGVALTPGKPDESTIYTFTLLHEDDDMAMPTKGDRLTDEQKELIKTWIAQGADFRWWVGARKV